MEKTKKLKLAVTLLVLLNVILVVFLLWPHINPFGFPDHELTRKADMYIQSQLGMMPDQIGQFEKLRQNFRVDTDRIRAQMKKNRQNLIMSLFEDPLPLATASQLLDELASCARSLEEHSFQHIQGIRRFCNQEQSGRLKTLMEDVFKKSEQSTPTCSK